MANGNSRVSSRLRLPAYLTISGTVNEPTASRTTIAAPTTSKRTRSLVKYGTRSSGIEGSEDSTVKRPRGPLTIWLRAPSDISTDRTSAWSPPTRAWDTLRVTGADEVAVPVGVSRPAGL